MLSQVYALLTNSQCVATFCVSNTVQRLEPPNVLSNENLQNKPCVSTRKRQKSPLPKRTAMSRPGVSAVFHGLPAEILLDIARYNQRETVTTLNSCFMSYEMLPICREMLHTGITTKSGADEHLDRTSEHILSLALADPSVDSIEDRMIRHASSIRHLRMDRRAPYLNTY
jgi:hypothetical protein